MVLGKIFKRHCEAHSSSTVEITDTIEASKLEHHKLHCLHMSLLFNAQSHFALTTLGLF